MKIPLSKEDKTFLPISHVEDFLNQYPTYVNNEGDDCKLENHMKECLINYAKEKVKEALYAKRGFDKDGWSFYMSNEEILEELFNNL